MILTICRISSEASTDGAAEVQAVLSTLVHWAKAVCDSDSLPQELKFLYETFRNNGYGE
jgi:hypothetical protein